MLWFKKQQKLRNPAMEPGTRVYAIGDVHGRLDLLTELLAKIDQDVAVQPAARIVEMFLGDYVDRGPASCEVIDRLCTPPLGRDRVCLTGNHEQILRDFLVQPEILSSWRFVGAMPTLVSYGVDPATLEPPIRPERVRDSFLKVLPERHRQFLHLLPIRRVIGDYLFVHAGVRPGVALDQQEPTDMMNIREMFLRSDKDFGAFVVHGHTPVTVPDIRPNRINIDTGAFATGRLTCLVLEGESRRFLVAGAPLPSAS